MSTTPKRRLSERRSSFSKLFGRRTSAEPVERAEPVLEAHNYTVKGHEAPAETVSNYSLLAPGAASMEIEEPVPRVSTSVLAAPLPAAEEIVHEYDPLTAVLIEQRARNRRETLKNALAPALSVDGRIVDRTRIFVAKAPHLPDRNDLELMQDVLNNYFREVLGLNMSVYSFLQNSPGDSAVGYLYFACALYEAGLRDNEKVFRECCDAMKSMYNAWADEAGKMFPLVLNLNGHDVVKEMMNVVNQSVYRLLAFIVTSQNLSAPALFFETAAPSNSCEEHMLTTNVAVDQQLLTDVFNERFQTALRSRDVHKFYSEERETPRFNLTRIKLHTPKFTANQLNLFEIQR